MNKQNSEDKLFNIEKPSEKKKINPSDDIFEKKRYTCKRCGKDKVKKRIGSRYVPKYCDDCLPIVKKLVMAKAVRSKHDKNWDELGVNEKLPDGSTIKLKDKHEKEFFVHMRDMYLKDFKWQKSSDISLLSNLLTLEIQMKRVEKILFQKTTEASIRNMSALAREIRSIQDALGISKSNREEKGKGSVIDKFADIMGRFLEYKRNNIHKFEVMCPKCKHVFAINQEKKLFSDFPSNCQGKLDGSHATPVEGID